MHQVSIAIMMMASVAGAFYIMSSYWFIAVFLVLIAIFILFNLHDYNPLEVRATRKHARLRLKKIQQAPKLAIDQLDSYVQFTAKIVTQNGHTLPEHDSPCVFYIYKIMAKWKTKAKSPSNGYDHHNKVIFEQESPSPVIKISDGNNTVMVNLDLFKAQLHRQLTVEVTDSKTCPARATKHSNRKYENYSSEIRYCKSGDSVIVTGRLTDKNGILEVVPSEYSNIPSFFCVGDMDTIAKHYKNIIKKQYAMPTSLIVMSLILLGFIGFIIWKYS